MKRLLAAILLTSLLAGCSGKSPSPPSPLHQWSRATEQSYLQDATDEGLTQAQAECGLRFMERRFTEVEYNAWIAQVLRGEGDLSIAADAQKECVG